MAVGASFADFAVVLVDATKGILTQTRRHLRICTLMGIRHFALALNKMDLVSFDRRVFEEIGAEFKGLAYALGAESVQAIPVCATDGDNVTEVSGRMPWYKGVSLLEYLEDMDALATDLTNETIDFIMPVQRVCRPDHTFRGFQGQIEGGKLAVGDELTILPGDERVLVKAIYHTDRAVSQAISGQPVTISLDREVDVSRGTVLIKGHQPEVSRAFTATLLWMDEEELVAGRHYFLKCGTKILPATVMSIKHRIDINSGKHISADKLFKNEMGECDISLSANMVFTSLSQNKALGGFILIDRLSNMTSACGAVLHSLRRSDNIVWSDTEITPAMRALAKGQQAMTIWFTGLSGAGKTVLANALEKRLHAIGKHTMILDGDNIRHGLNRNLGFKEADRIENIRRIAEVSKLMNDAGLIVLTSFISPYESERENARGIIGGAFKLVHVSTALAVCEERDTKGLYAKARRGEIPNFTGISDVYEEPGHADLVIDTAGCSVDEAVDMLMEHFFGD
jgi:bifunctional enzyme CysN/CysC